LIFDDTEKSIRNFLEGNLQMINSFVKKGTINILGAGGGSSKDHRSGVRQNTKENRLVRCMSHEFG